MSVSNATMIVAADGPKKRTAANTNASDTEIRALMDGSFMLNEPVRIVRRASHIHCDPVGRTTKSYADAPIT